MRFVAPLLTALLSTPAFAGGFGIVLGGGFHQDQQHYYSDHSEDGVPYNDRLEFDQFSFMQNQAHGNGGLEFVIGDRDDRFQGIFRIMYMMDAPQKNPTDLADFDSEWVVGQYRDSARHVGAASAGMQVGIFGNPKGLQGGISAHIGSGFLTADHTEFLFTNVGPSITWQANRQIQVFGDFHHHMRFRKGDFHGAQFSAGMRYMFD